VRCYYGIDIAPDGTRVVARLVDAELRLATFAQDDASYLEMQAALREHDPRPRACIPSGVRTAALAEELLRGIRGMKVTLVPPMLIDSSASTEERARSLAKMAKELA